MRGDQDPSIKDPSTLTQIHTVHRFTSFPQRDLQTRVTVHWGKRNNQNFPGSELTLIPGEKHHCGPQVRVGPYGGQVINSVLAQIHLTVCPKNILWLFSQLQNA